MKPIHKTLAWTFISLMLCLLLPQPAAQAADLADTLFLPPGVTKPEISTEPKAWPAEGYFCPLGQTAGETYWYVREKDWNLNYYGITIIGHVNIILENDCTLTCDASGSSYPGILVPGYLDTDGKPLHSLTIWATSDGSNKGKLIAKGGPEGAGIGGYEGETPGPITINGGEIEATGGYYGAGIGGSMSAAGIGGSGGIITINGGEVTATGAMFGAGIGGGGGNMSAGTSGTISILGGIVTANGGENGASAIGGGGGTNVTPAPMGDITIGSAAKVTTTVASGGDAPIGPGHSTAPPAFTLSVASSGNTHTATVFANERMHLLHNGANGFQYKWAYSTVGTTFQPITDAPNGPACTYTGVDIKKIQCSIYTHDTESPMTIFSADINTTLTGDPYYDPVHDSNRQAPNATELKDQTTLGEGGNISSWYVLKGNRAGNESIAIKPGSHVNLILNQGTSMTANGPNTFPGISVPGSASLTIWAARKDGNGVLTASGNGGAGIGGGAQQTGTLGPITINGGTVDAASIGGAGIGGGAQQTGTLGPITINGGTVEASSNFGAGIGGGVGQSGTLGPITIHGGTVTASSEFAGAGIGTGARSSISQPKITLDKAAKIKATGGKTDSGYGPGAPIGTGGQSSKTSGTPALALQTITPSAIAGARGAVTFEMINLRLTGTPTYTYILTPASGATITIPGDAGGFTAPASAGTYQVSCIVNHYRVGTTDFGITTESLPLTVTSLSPYKADPSIIGANPGLEHELTETGISGQLLILGAHADTLRPVVRIRNERGEVVHTAPGAALQPARPTGHNAGFAVPEADLTGLPAGRYTLWMSAPSDPYNESMADTCVGFFLIADGVPHYLGDNQLAVLTGSVQPLPVVFRVSGLAPAQSETVTLRVAGRDYPAILTRNGEHILSIDANFSAPGEHPLTLHPAEGDPVPLGTLRVVDHNETFAGELQDLVDEGARFVPVARGVQLAVTGTGTRTQFILKFKGKGTLTARALQMRVNPFGASGKATLAVPDLRRINAEVTHSRKKGTVKLEFRNRDLQNLALGTQLLQITLKSASGESKSPPITLLSLESLAQNWALPTSLRAAAGTTYDLMRLKDTDPDVTVKSGNKRIATVDERGILTVHRQGKVTLTLALPGGATKSCKLTALPNSSSYTWPLHIPGQAGLFTSPRRVYYEKGALRLQMFIYNRTGKTLAALPAMNIELYQNGALVYAAPATVSPLKTPLKQNAYITRTITLTTDAIPGIDKKPFDLSNPFSFHPALRAPTAAPLHPDTQGTKNAPNSAKQQP